MSRIDSKNYTPTDGEAFMNGKQKTYFRLRLEAWRQEILDGSKTTITNLQEETNSLPDIVDRASAESDKALELRTRDRQRKLISKIEAAIRRIDAGTYGYCDETGEPIGVKRLVARPTATLSIEAQERHERKERTVRDQ
ncbi:MAG: RNA polymerase-binding protein DksA [Hyphomonadaceae bacterium]